MCSVSFESSDGAAGTGRFVSAKPVTIVGGGAATQADLEDALRHAPGLIAADGGTGFALRCGHVPEAVIGDLDSLEPGDGARMPKARVHHVPDQDNTDFDKVMARVAAPLILGVGFLGARLDHQLAGLSTLVRCADQPCILLGAHEVILHAPPHLQVDLSGGEVVSLYPLAPVTGRSEGLEWPIDGLTLSPVGQIGTSNRALGPVTLETDGPGLLLILPRAALDLAVRAVLSASPGTAPRSAL